jgi:D-allulose-6-phosphate 3-epimerase
MVNPGFAAQRFMRPMLLKVEALRELRERAGHRYRIEVDGACNPETFADLAHAGAEVFVVGSTGLFGLDPEVAVAWQKMRAAFDAAVGRA